MIRLPLAAQTAAIFVLFVVPFLLLVYLLWVQCTATHGRDAEVI